MFTFSPRLLSETFLILRRIQRVIIINVQISSSTRTRYSSQILIKLRFCRHTRIFGKSSGNKFHENPSSGSQVVP
jgi:hypothetical protein